MAGRNLTELSLRVLRANYVCSENNRIVNYDDYTINDLFAYVDESRSPHTIDRFTCHYNKKASSLNSKYFQPGTDGAFTQDWAYETICPPVYLTVTVINHLSICEAAGTLIVPLWISAHYWISLCKDRVHGNDFIHDWIILPHLSNLFERGKSRNAIFGNGQLKFTVVALRIDFSVSARKYRTGFCTFLCKRCKTCC